MDILTNLITTIGLDKSFFYQFAIIAITYFVTKKLFLQPYYNLLQKRQDLTKGKEVGSKKLEQNIEELKETYEQKAAKIHKDFQSVYSEIKKQAERNFGEQKQNITEKQLVQTAQKRNHLVEEQAKQDKELEKDIPNLAQSLVEKIKGLS